MVRLFVGLAHHLKLDHRHPHEDLVASFVSFLAENYKTQKEVRSMVSTLKACLLRANFDVSAFETVRVSLLLRSVGINKRTPTRQRPPVDCNILRRVVQHWRSVGGVGTTLAAAAITMFVTNLRQSNLFPPTKRAFDQTRQLVWRDVVWRDEYIKIQIKWGKAQQKTSTRYQKIPRAGNLSLCPVRALEDIRPRASTGHSPIFAFQDGSPIPISFVSKAWQAAMKALDLDTQGFTLHSIRRGGARFLQDMGVPDTNIANHAGWKSSAIYDYINTPENQPAFCALQKLR